MTEPFADRLVAACRVKGSPICVGVDPVYARLPRCLQPEKPDTIGPQQAIEAIEQYVSQLLEVVAPYSACVKIQSACYERYRWRGVRAYERAIERAKQLGLIVIADAKRGDIGISAEHYAQGCLGDDLSEPHPRLTSPDALTINPYLGADSIRPFLDLATAQGKGLFALVRTSNPGGDDLQGLPLADDRSVAEAVAQMIATLGDDPTCIAGCGYSLLGAVVGATKPQDAQKLRRVMSQQIFLVPGFGAQGGTADDLRGFFRSDGTGALITASRSVIFAYEKNDVADWKTAVERAAADMHRQIAEVIGLL